MKRTIQLILLLCLLGGTAPAAGQTMERDSLITVRDATVESRDGRVTVRFLLTAPRQAVKRNYRYRLTPELAVADSAAVNSGVDALYNKVSLTPLSPVGKRKSRSEHRRAVLGGRAASHHPLIKTRPHLPDTTRYEISIPYQEWMGFHPLALRLNSEKQTYRHTWNQGSELLVSKIQLLPSWRRSIPLLRPVSGPETPTARLAHTQPWLQSTPCCQQPPRYLNLLLPPDGALQLDFRLGSTRLREGLNDNRYTLQHFADLWQQVRTDDSVHIDRITLLGQALSDGDRLLETTLSERRAQEVKEHLIETLQIDPQQIEIYSPTDLWQSLRTQIAHSALPDGQKQQMTDIIDQTPDPAERERRLLALDSGTGYAYLKTHLLPGLRDAVYVQLHYTNLSDPGRTQLNRAIELINSGDYAAALVALQQLPGTDRSRHLSGICRLMADSTLAPLLEGKLQVDPANQQFIIALDEVAEQLTTAAPAQSEVNYEVLFRVGSNKLDSCFAGNAATLKALRELVQDNTVGDRLRVNRVRITGEASPEGGYGTNVRLAAARARALQAYLQQQTRLPETHVETTHAEPSWKELRSAILADRKVPHRVEVIRIIDETLPGAGREAQLRALGEGRAYRYLNEHLLPGLRNAACVQITFDRQTDEHRAVINRAIGEIRKGNYGEALRLLEPVGSDSRAALPLRVARTMNNPETTLP